MYINTVHINIAVMKKSGRVRANNCVSANQLCVFDVGLRFMVGTIPLSVTCDPELLVPGPSHTGRTTGTLECSCWYFTAAVPSS